MLLCFHGHLFYIFSLHLASKSQLISKSIPVHSCFRTIFRLHSNYIRLRKNNSILTHGWLCTENRRQLAGQLRLVPSAWDIEERISA
ncbi:hypothetical protein MANES_12G097620v8 [Manihot esculenta]|uniref:Uncharacterized protein n=1 Tax=Manihot esculenta TaxID=3983 RepID=A0ACB7GQN6_MANES|nr:hypothetical protein MANES_12G097620v8 [Manihot esculenta]